MPRMIVIKHMKCGGFNLDMVELNDELKFYCRQCNKVFKPHTDHMAYQIVHTPRVA